MERGGRAGSIPGCACSPRLSLQVNREIVSGLKYIQHTFRKGVKSKCCSAGGQARGPRPGAGRLSGCPSVHRAAGGPGCACSSGLGVRSRPERQQTCHRSRGPVPAGGATLEQTGLPTRDSRVVTAALGAAVAVTELPRALALSQMPERLLNSPVCLFLPLVDKTEYMVGSYGPRAEEYEFLTPMEEAPKGMLARGSYNVKSKFTDDDKTDHLSWEWNLTIKKEWKD